MKLFEVQAIDLRNSSGAFFLGPNKECVLEKFSDPLRRNGGQIGGFFFSALSNGTIFGAVGGLCAKSTLGPKKKCTSQKKNAPLEFLKSIP